MTYFCPALDPPLDRSGRKTTTLVRDLEYFIHTKFHQNPSSGSGEEFENVNSLTDDGRTDDGRTTDGRRTTRDHNRSLEPKGSCALKIGKIGRHRHRFWLNFFGRPTTFLSKKFHRPIRRLRCFVVGEASGDVRPMIGRHFHHDIGHRSSDDRTSISRRSPDASRWHLIN